MELIKAFALAVPHEKAIEIRDEVAFFQAVKAAVVKSTSSGAGKTDAEMDQAIRQIVSKAIAADGVVDIFSAAGLKKPDISILSEEFLADARGLPQKSLAVELLRKLLNEELKLTDDEVAFYDALETNDSAVKVLGDAVLTQIARELTQTIRSSVTIDWTVKEAVRARLRVLVRRLLRKYGYPPDKTEKAVETVLKQAELLAAEWAA